MAAQGVLDHPGNRVIVGGLVAAELLGRLLEPFLVKRFQVEGEGRFKDLLQKTDRRFARFSASGMLPRASSTSRGELTRISFQSKKRSCRFRNARSALARVAPPDRPRTGIVPAPAVAQARSVRTAS